MKDDTAQESRRLTALNHIERGKECVEGGDMRAAKSWFQKSMDLYPTPEGYTFYAWMLSFEGHFDEAISFCKKAIEIDREFGNPYNDIGSYLIAKGKPDEAIGWLEKAKNAKRYEPRHFPYTNLGRIYLNKGWLQRARMEFTQALRLSPDNDEILQLLDVIQRGLN